LKGQGLIIKPTVCLGTLPHCTVTVAEKEEAAWGEAATDISSNTSVAFASAANPPLEEGLIDLAGVEWDEEVEGEEWGSDVAMCGSPRMWQAVDSQGDCLMLM